MPLQIIRQDITKMKVDAIVNSTNYKLVGLSGIDLAIHQCAGPLFDMECRRIAPLGLGEAKITKGYDLDAKYVIHTAGPVWEGGLVGESILLKSCYLESLKLAVKNGCESVAFPLISSGNYGYPKDQVLRFAVQVISDFLLENELDVYLCVYDRKSYEFSKALYDDIRDFIGSSPTENYFSLTKPQIARPCKGNDYSIYETDKYCSEAVYERKPTVKKQKHPKQSEDSFEEYMKNMDKSFAYKLFDWIDKRGMTDVECYKKANIDKKTFSKIKCNPQTYKPSKQTAVAFAIALKLSLSETQDLLASAGLTLSYSFTFDKIIIYFIQKENYNVFEINEALFEFDQILLGC